MIKVNFDNLIRQTLPWFKRRPVRLSLLSAFVTPLKSLFVDFDTWRRNVMMEVHVTTQVGVLEGYLRKKYGQPVEIKIITFDDGALEVGLEREGDTMSFDIATTIEVAPFIELPLTSEVRSLFGDADYLIYVPATIDTDNLRADIERFRTAGSRYRIVAAKYLTLDDGRRVTMDNGDFITLIQF